ncbi:hypothetical protein B0T20DRAFT_461625 [Sordaria brevicollis]|uniref:Uncharacterized protein n=1 Tax=Sordaria brevicollis TaxID=83679 RepID=A0AAE0PCY4_SORBR|nr:hypothetical protein B0T20DRAFT_461625 [Sordaria brevicollis]
MKLPPNIPTALILTFLFSLQVPLRLAAPLSHDKLFPNEPILPQIRYERIDNGRITTRHSNPNSNQDFPPSCLPDSLSLSPTSFSTSTGSPANVNANITTNPPGRFLGRLSKRSTESTFDTTAIEAQLNQLDQRRRQSSHPPPSEPRVTHTLGRYARPLKHLFAHAYHSKLGRGVIDSDSPFDTFPAFPPVKRILSESADDDLSFTSFDNGAGAGAGGAVPTLLKMITIEPTITINSTSIERRGPGTYAGPGAGSYLAGMSLGGAVPRPRESSLWERRDSEHGEDGAEEVKKNETSFMSRRISRIENRREEKKSNGTITEENSGDGNFKGTEMEKKKEEGKVEKREGSVRHGRYHRILTSVAASA